MDKVDDVGHFSLLQQCKVHYPDINVASATIWTLSATRRPPACLRRLAGWVAVPPLLMAIMRLSMRYLTTTAIRRPAAAAEDSQVLPQRPPPRLWAVRARVMAFAGPRFVWWRCVHFCRRLDALWRRRHATAARTGSHQGQIEFHHAQHQDILESRIEAWTKSAKRRQHQTWSSQRSAAGAAVGEASESGRLRELPSCPTVDHTIHCSWCGLAWRAANSANWSSCCLLLVFFCESSAGFCLQCAPISTKKFIIVPADGSTL